MRAAHNVAVLSAVLLAAAPAGTVAPRPVAYAAPVDAVVTDPFRPPSTPYGPGNLGLEYATEAGAPVRAAAAGTVTFAGQVGGTRHVTVLHADQARTTYGGLATVAVTRGQVVDAGQPVGTSGVTLLWTVRLGEAYLDPAVLLAASGDRRAHLVPVSEEWPLDAGGRGP